LPKHRRHEQEDHGHAVKGEELVESLGADEVLLGTRELRPHHERLDPGDEEERGGGDEVAHSDPLVVDRRQEARQSARFRPDLLEALDARLHYRSLSR
jgi:hypothetical protein